MNMAAPSLSPEALAALTRYDFPGNIRELQNILERACLLCRRADDQVDAIAIEHLPHQLAPTLPEFSGIALRPGGVAGKMDALASNEKAMVVNALCQSNWNQSAAAKLLGISRDNIRYRMKKYGIGAAGA